MQAKGETLEMTKLEVVQGAGEIRRRLRLGAVRLGERRDRSAVLRAGWQGAGQLPDREPRHQQTDERFRRGGAGRRSRECEARCATAHSQNLRATLDLQLTGLRSEKLKDFTPATFGLNARDRERPARRRRQACSRRASSRCRSPPTCRSTSRRSSRTRRSMSRRRCARECRCRAARSISCGNSCRRWQRIDGNMALDVNVGGTIARPAFSGSADMTINAARFSNPTLPALIELQCAARLRRRFAEPPAIPRRAGGRAVYRHGTDHISEADGAEPSICSCAPTPFSSRETTS